MSAWSACLWGLGRRRIKHRAESAANCSPCTSLCFLLRASEVLTSLSQALILAEMCLLSGVLARCRLVFSSQRSICLQCPALRLSDLRINAATYLRTIQSRLVFLLISPTSMVSLSCARPRRDEPLMRASPTSGARLRACMPE
eukprot:5998694-Pleurochrysis_carterae.AAC.2